MTHALTFDVEDYFHVHAYASLIDSARWDDYPQRVGIGTRIVLDILAERGVRATFFVLGWVARRDSNLVREIVAAGHELASHGYWHQRVDAQTQDEFRRDIRLAKGTLEDMTGRSVTAYRAPSFSITTKSPWAHETLVEEGYSVDSSMSAGRGEKSLHAGSRPFVIETPAGPLQEFPLPRMHLAGRPLPVGGGGYFRLFPEWLTHAALRKIDGKGRPFCVYLHPWEFDVEQPRINCSPITAFRHHVGIGKTAGRLRRLLDEFAFAPLGDVLSRELPTPQRRAA